jgi:hypothetical protein
MEVARTNDGSICDQSGQAECELRVFFHDTTSSDVSGCSMQLAQTRELRLWIAQLLHRSPSSSIIPARAVASQLINQRVVKCLGLVTAGFEGLLEINLPLL